MDENFEYFLEKMGPSIETRHVAPSSVERYRGRLPDQLLAYWEQHGWCGYADGLLWTVNPQEYEAVRDAWIGDTRLNGEDTYHVIARTAFGELYCWGERSGDSLRIQPWYALAFSSAGAEKYIAASRADEAIRWFFGGLKRHYFDALDDRGRPLFMPALEKLGRLQSNQMYAFVPALALGGSATLNRLQKVSIFEQLTLLAQLAPLRITEAAAS